MTRAQLLRFIRLRNRKPLPVTHADFRDDAQTCGFLAGDIGPLAFVPLSWGASVFYWRTPFGVMSELDGRLRLHATLERFWVFVLGQERKRRRPYKYGRQVRKSRH